MVLSLLLLVCALTLAYLRPLVHELLDIVLDHSLDQSHRLLTSENWILGLQVRWNLGVGQFSNDKIHQIIIGVNFVAQLVGKRQSESATVAPEDVIVLGTVCQVECLLELLKSEGGSQKAVGKTLVKFLYLVSMVWPRKAKTSLIFSQKRPKWAGNSNISCLKK